MTIKIDNSPNWYEYLFIVLASLSIAIVSPSLLYIMLLLAAILIINLSLYSKNANIILSQASFEIRFKIGFVTYRKFRQRFSKIIVGLDTVEFYDDDKMIFSLDVDPAYEDCEDNEVSSISLWSKQRNISLGNKKNCLQVFSEIKQFYLSQNSNN